MPSQGPSAGAVTVLIALALPSVAADNPVPPDPRDLVEQIAEDFTERLDRVESTLLQAAERLDATPASAGRLVVSALSGVDGAAIATVIAYYRWRGEDPPPVIAEIEERRTVLELVARELEEDVLALVTPYVPGDENGDLEVGVEDALGTLRHLFSGGPVPACAAGADANGDGRLEVTDAIAALQLATGTISAPVPAVLSMDLERPENRGCPWQRTVRQENRGTKATTCPTCAPPDCSWHRYLDPEIFCFFGYCILVRETCRYYYCCGPFCSDDC